MSSRKECGPLKGHAVIRQTNIYSSQRDVEKETINTLKICCRLVVLVGRMKNMQILEQAASRNGFASAKQPDCVCACECGLALLGSKERVCACLCACMCVYLSFLLFLNIFEHLSRTFNSFPIVVRPDRAQRTE